jgi:hypothetical protein
MGDACDRVSRMGSIAAVSSVFCRQRVRSKLERVRRTLRRDLSRHFGKYRHWRKRWCARRAVTPGIRPARTCLRHVQHSGEAFGVS